MDKPFAAKEDQLLCTDCYSQEYSSRCQECKKSIMPGGRHDPAFCTCAKSPSPNPPIPPHAPLHPSTLMLDLELGAVSHAGDILADLTAAGSSGQR